MDPHPIKILLIDDDEDDYVLTRELLLEIEGGGYKLDWLATYEAALAMMQRNEYDVYLLDYRLGEHNGLDLLREAVENGCHRPIILLTGRGDREVDVAAMKAGAADFLMKGQFEAPLLERSLRYAIERSKNLEALRQSEERLRHLVESANVIPWEMDPATWQFTYVGPQAVKIFDYPLEEWYAENFWVEHIHPEDRRWTLNYCREAISLGQDHDFEYRMLTAAGQTVWLRAIVSLVADDGSPTWLRGFMFDITGHKHMEAELLKARKLESIGILAGGIAHDFNNTLTSILGNVSLAKMFIDPADRSWERLTAAEKACQRATALTQQLLTFSKGGAPIKKATSITELIKDSASFVLSGSNVRCVFSLPDDLWPVEVDEGQISSVINNLVLNAQQAMPEGGVIEISGENVKNGAEESADDHPAPHPPLNSGQYVKISVEDHGFGIPEAQLDKIFDPYFTTKQKGSGLGLATSYSILSKHLGNISVTSQLGVGTTFYIYLPASQGQIRRGKDGEEKPPSDQGKILVMDDEEDIRELTGQVLPHYGFEVVTAKDGAEAIELYQKAMNAGQPFDAVLMDLTIPGGMGGEEAIIKLLELDPKVKAVVSSGYANEPIMANFKQYGFRGAIAKPYKTEALSKVLHETIRKECG